MLTLEKIHPFLIVSFGAFLGSNIRYIFFEKLSKIRIKKDTIILLINVFASFLFGLCYSFILNINSLTNSNQIGLFFLIGILGSFSTFSTFIYDLFELFSDLQYYRAFKLLFFSLFLGVTSVFIGILLGNL